VAGPAGTLAAPAAEVAAARRALNFWGAKTPEQGAQTTLFAATSPTLTPRTAGGHLGLGLGVGVGVGVGLGLGLGLGLVS